MAQLDKTFPTNDCSMCIISPKLVECGRHLNIEILAPAEVEAISGEPGSFTVKVRQQARYRRPGQMHRLRRLRREMPQERCRTSSTRGWASARRLTSRYPQAVPLKYAIDKDHCIYFKKGASAGPARSSVPAGPWISTRQDQDRELEVGAIILAPGFQPFDPCEKPDIRLRPATPTWSPPWSSSASCPPPGPSAAIWCGPRTTRSPKRSPGSSASAPGTSSTTPTAPRSAACTPSRRRSSPRSTARNRPGRRHLLHGHAHLRQGLRAVLQPGQGEHGVRFIRSRVHTIDPAAGRRPEHQLRGRRAARSRPKTSTWWSCPWAWR